MNKSNQFYLVLGAAHYNSNSLQPDPYPKDNTATINDWVEKDNKPSRLNATVSSGSAVMPVAYTTAWIRK